MMSVTVRNYTMEFFAKAAAIAKWVRGRLPSGTEPFALYDVAPIVAPTNQPAALILPTPLLLLSPPARLLALPPPKNLNGHAAPGKVTKGAKRADITLGTFYYLGDILDHLDSYRASLACMKHYDADTYALYKRVGGHIAPRTDKRFAVRLNLKDNWLKMRPAFGFAHLGLAGVDECKDCTLPPQIMYYSKLKRYADVQPTNLDVYRVSIVWSDDDKKVWKDAKKFKGFWWASFHVSVDDEGHVALLKERKSTPLRIKSKRRSEATIHRIEWHFPHCTLGRKYEGGEVSPNEWAADTFGIVANATAEGSSGAQVLAERDGIAARFNVPPTRTAYFFKDREKVVNVNGKTKKIFHHVSQHDRDLGDGRTTIVKQHYRGLRQFTWGGHDVLITVPDHHHPDMNRFDAAGMIVDPDTPWDDDYATTKDVGKMMRELFGRAG